MELSVCIPVYNGAKSIGRLVDELEVKLSDIKYEIVLVNDGSKDDSEEVCIDIAKAKDYVTFISLRRNYGEHNAVMCGLNYCKGDYTVIIDDDFQNPPSEIIKLLTEIKKGYDVVYAKYRKKKHSIFRNLGSKFNDIVATKLLNKPKNLYLCSFKIVSKEVVDEVIKYKGPFPYVDGLILRVTDNITSTYVEHCSRVDGESNYTIGKLVTLWLNMFINFSIVPLRIVSILGGITSISCFILGIYFIIEKLLHPDAVLGWASTVVLILFLSGLQMMFLGIIGEYIGKNYLDKNGTPQWTIKKVF